MVYQPNTWNQSSQLTHKQLILQQILICNKLFSGFEATPTILDPKLGTHTFTTEAHSGKAILLGVLTLEANARPILPEEYQTRTQPIKNEIEQKVHCTGTDGKQYYGLGIIAPNPITQLEAIIKVQHLYSELLAAIYSLHSFSDVIPKHMIQKGEDITEEEITEKESIEFESET